MKKVNRNKYWIFCFVVISALAVYFTLPHRMGQSQERESPGAVFLVTTAADSGAGSFRQAITDANASAGADTINFNIPGGGFQTIVLASELPTITDPVTIDGTTQPGYSGIPLVILSGSRVHITAGSSTVKAISVIRATSGGITLETGGGNLVTGCFLGINPANEADTTTSNASGVEIFNSPDNQIGANFATALRNVMAYNTGVRITGAGSTGNVVIGNIFGMRSNGTDAATGNGNYGVYVEGASNNRIGGTTAAERNILSGYNRTSNSSAGIWLLNASGNEIQGNYIGTDITGTLARPNRDGIRIDESPNNMIGAAAGTTFAGPCTGGCNLISGNFRDGVRLNGEATTGNRLDYNYIGLNVTGLAALRNNTIAIHFTTTGPNIIGKPPDVDRPVGRQVGISSPTEVVFFEDRLTGNCGSVNTATGFYGVTHAGTGTVFSDVGEVSFDPEAGTVVVGNGLRIRLRGPGFGRSAAIVPPHGSGILPFLIYTRGKPLECGLPVVLQHLVGGIVDDTSPGSTGNSIHNNVIDGSVNRIDNLSQPNSIVLNLTFGSSYVINQNLIFSQSLTSIAVQNGVGVRHDRNLHSFQASGPLNFRTDTTPFDLTSPTANNNLTPPVFRVERTTIATHRLTGNGAGWPRDARIRISFSEQDHYRSLNGTEHVTTYPSAIEDLFVTVDSNGNAQFDLILPNLTIFGEQIVAKATVEQPGQTGTLGDSSEFARPQKSPRGVFDFGGDGPTDFAVVRPGAGNGDSYWFILNSGDLTQRVEQFGLGGDIPVAGDYQGDEKTDLAVWRPSNWTFYHSRINGSPTTNFVGIPWGLPGDIPVVGDFDDDGANDAAIFRPSDRTWYIRRSVDGSLFVQQWGLATDKPIPADYDGDGRTDIAVYRDGVWYISVCPQCPPLIRTFGLSTDIPVPGDYDGDGIADIAVWRPSDGVWWIQQSRTNSPVAIQWGTVGDKPLRGDWDGDGRNDIAVWRPSTGDWWVLRSADNSLLALHWGQSGDIPIPAFP